eukprot:SM000148S01045  [mRNA]  locus=s148:367098:368198:+ [translate_table: standard]
MYPAKKYCDLTGFEAPYMDPKTKLRYCNVETFKLARSLPDEMVQGFLSIRKAELVLKLTAQTHSLNSVQKLQELIAQGHSVRKSKTEEPHGAA